MISRAPHEVGLADLKEGRDINQHFEASLPGASRHHTADDQRRHRQLPIALGAEQRDGQRGSAEHANLYRPFLEGHPHVGVRRRRSSWLTGTKANGGSWSLIRIAGMDGKNDNNQEGKYDPNDQHARE